MRRVAATLVLPVLGVLLGAGSVLALTATGAAADHCEDGDTDDGPGFPAGWGHWELDDLEVDREGVVEAFDEIGVETVGDVLDRYDYDEDEWFDGDCRLNELEALALYADTDAWSELRDWFEFLHQDGDGDLSARELRAWINEHTDRTIGLAFQPSLHFGTVADAVGLPPDRTAPDDGDGEGEDTDEAADEDDGTAGGPGGGSAADAGSGAAGESAFAEIAGSMGEAAGDLVGRLGESLSPEESPDFLASDTYQRHYQRMMGWAALIMLPLAMVAIGSAVLRGESARIGETLLGIPAVYLLGTVAVFVVGAAGGLATAMSQMLASDTSGSALELSDNVNEFLLEPSETVPGLVLLLGLIIALAALVTEIWLILSDAAVYAVVLFIPLAFAGRVWPNSPAALWGRKLLMLALAFVVSKVVIFALWALTVDGLADTTGAAGEGGVGGAIALAALLLLLAVSPLAVLRLVPLVEGVPASGSGGGGVMAAGRAPGTQGMQLAGVSVGTSGASGGGAGGGGGRLPVSTGGGSGGRGRRRDSPPRGPGGPGGPVGSDSARDRSGRGSGRRGTSGSSGTSDNQRDARSPRASDTSGSPGPSDPASGGGGQDNEHGNAEATSPQPAAGDGRQTPPAGPPGSGGSGS